MGNRFGNLFSLTSFGESHGKAVGGVIDGCPSNIPLDIEKIQLALNLRKPGTSTYVSARKESDKLEILSGLYQGKSLGSPIGFVIENKDSKSEDYDALKDVFRPSHGDYTFQEKYGIRDHRGGGRQSARETVSRVVAGEIARQVLFQFLPKLKIHAFTSQIGKVSLPEEDTIDFSNIYTHLSRTPSKKTDTAMLNEIAYYRDKGDSIGGVIECRVTGLPTGLGEPVFHKMEAQLAHAIMGIGACKGFEIGKGFAMAKQSASVMNDQMESLGGKVSFSSNNSGGIQGGISNGQELVFRAAFKAPSSIASRQKAINTTSENLTLEINGRHDPCIVPRAVPIVEAMTAMVLLDLFLMHQRVGDK